MIQEYRNHRDIEFIQPNYRYEMDLVPDDPYYSTDQYAHQLTEAESAWSTTTGSSSVIIAVIGTGIDLSHPDLVNNIWINSGEIPGNGLDDDANGYIDDINGWNFINNNGTIYADEHETVVAGVIAAEGNNSQGIAGVTWHSKLMSLQVSHTASTASDQVAAAINYAVGQGARIINMSFGNYFKEKYGDLVVKAAIENAFDNNCLLIATAGNESVDAKRYPAALYQVMATGSTDQQDKRSMWNGSYSATNYGDWVDIAAPGTSILSTEPGASYDVFNGTSLSAPYVSGVAALLFSRLGTLSNWEARGILENLDNCDPINETEDEYFSMGCGRINTRKALRSLSSILSLERRFRYAFGEIVNPINKEVFDENINIPISFVAWGDRYTVHIRDFNSSVWNQLAKGNIRQAQQGDLISLNLNNPGFGTYYVRVQISKDNTSPFERIDKTKTKVHTDSKIFSVDRTQTNWPGPVLGQTAHIRSGAIVMDIDEDGRNEIIQSSYGDGSAMGYTHIWNDDGTYVPGWPQPLMGDPSCSTSAVGDIDGDGDFEIITTTYSNGAVYAWHWQNGQLMTGDWPKSLGGVIRGNPILADLDGDGDAEIIVGVIGVVNKIIAFQGDGSVVWEKPLFAEAPMAAADIDKDGDVELFVDSISNSYLLDHLGNIIQQWPGGSRKGSVIGDLDRDDRLEIINIGNSYLRALSYNGPELWSTFLSSGSGYGAISMGDLDNDWFPEIFVSNSDSTKTGNLLYAFDHTGQALPGFPKNTLGRMFQNAATIADLNEDGEKEVIVGSTSGLVFSWQKDGSATDGFPRLLSDDFGIYSPITITDLDLDGDIDLLTGASASHERDGGRVHVSDLDSSYDPYRVDWGIG